METRWRSPSERQPETRLSLIHISEPTRLRRNEKCNCKITANNAASAINGICIIVQEYASALQLPALHVLAVMAALMADPESEHGAMKEEAKESEAAE